MLLRHELWLKHAENWSRLDGVEQQAEIDAGKLSKKQARQSFVDETMEELQKRRPDDIIYSRTDL